MTRVSRLFFESPARYLLLLAAVIQLTLVFALFTMGRLTVSPNKINEHGLLISVLPDTITYQAQASDAVEVLKHSGIQAWLAARYDAHVKFYSLSYLLFGPLFGRNILGAEPFNLRNYPTNSLFRELEYDLAERQQELNDIRQRLDERLIHWVTRNLNRYVLR